MLSKFGLVLLLLLGVCRGSLVFVNLDQAIREVEQFYLSFAMDAYLVGTVPKWLNFDFK